MKVIIAVPDFTREAHLKKILSELIVHLEKQAIQKKDTEILIATGLHRQPTKDEIKNNVGDISNRIKISSHDYKHVSYFGASKTGVPIYLNKKLKEADAIVTVGVVEPHLYAGYSGGVKVVAIGLAGEKTINFTHHPRFLDHSGTRICSIKNNPFQDFLWEVASLLPIRYSINMLNNEQGHLVKVFEGPARACFKKAVTYSRHGFEKNVDSYVDTVICDIPSEKGINIYQASRIFNYITNVKNPIVKKHSMILVKANLEEGFGKGLGEKRFMNMITNMKNPKDLIAEIKKGGCLAGEHRAYMVAKALLKAKLGFISKNSHVYKNKGLPFLFFKNLAEAQTFIKDQFTMKPKIIYLKNAFTTILNKTLP